MSIRARFDPIVHAPHRLRICAMLADVKELEFAILRDTLSLSDSVLSKQLAVLAQAGYVRSRRAKRNARQRVWLALTKEGRKAFTGHVAELRAIVEQNDGALAERPSRTARTLPAPATRLSGT